MDRLLKSLVVPNQTGKLISAYDYIYKKDFTTGDTPGSSDVMSERDVLPSQMAVSAVAAVPPEPTEPNYERNLGLGDAAPSLQSIEDWEKEHPYAGPKAKVVPLYAASSGPAVVIRFHELCTKIGLRPTFELLETSLMRFSGKALIGEQVVELAEPFASKKEAKEQVCKAALPLLEELERTNHSRKRKSAEMAQAGPPSRISKDELGAEDWVSILMNYLQKQKAPYADYKELQTETTPFYFSCTVRFQGCPARPFGEADDLYPNKKDAKKVAARDAVLWLRNQGKLAGTRRNAPTKRQKQDVPITTTTEPPQSGQSAELHSTLKDTTTITNNASLPQQVNEMVASLGLNQPQFEVQIVDAGLDSLINMTVKFHNRDIALDSRLAREIVVKNVYGKKKAKEACCRDVLRLLDEVKRSRDGMR